LLNIHCLETTHEPISEIQNKAPLKKTEEPEPELKDGTTTVLNLTEGFGLI
jgi:hypothetical protein